MAQITDFLGPGAVVGEANKVERNLGIWMRIGTGSFTVVQPFSVTYRGSVDFDCLETGAVTLEITLTDMDPDATSGPATVSYNGIVDTAATYEVTDDGKQLLVQSTVLPWGELTLEDWWGGTWVGMTGTISLWTGPESTALNGPARPDVRPRRGA